jgi:hypothetical protein
MPLEVLAATRGQGGILTVALKPKKAHGEAELRQLPPHRS